MKKLNLLPDSGNELEKKKDFKMLWKFLNTYIVKFIKCK